MRLKKDPVPSQDPIPIYQVMASEPVYIKKEPVQASVQASVQAPNRLSAIGHSIVAAAGDTAKSAVSGVGNMAKEKVKEIGTMAKDKAKEKISEIGTSLWNSLPSFMGAGVDETFEYNCLIYLLIELLSIPEEKILKTLNTYKNNNMNLKDQLERLKENLKSRKPENYDIIMDTIYELNKLNNMIDSKIDEGEKYRMLTSFVYGLGNIKNANQFVLKKMHEKTNKYVDLANGHRHFANMYLLHTIHVQCKDDLVEFNNYVKQYHQPVQRPSDYRPKISRPKVSRPTVRFNLNHDSDTDSDDDDDDDVIIVDTKIDNRKTKFDLVQYYNQRPDFPIRLSMIDPAYFIKVSVFVNQTVSDFTLKVKIPKIIRQILNQPGYEHVVKGVLEFNKMDINETDGRSIWDYLDKIYYHDIHHTKPSKMENVSTNRSGKALINLVDDFDDNLTLLSNTLSGMSIKEEKNSLIDKETELVHEKLKEFSPLDFFHMFDENGEERNKKLSPKHSRHYNDIYNDVIETYGSLHFYKHNVLNKIIGNKKVFMI